MNPVLVHLLIRLYPRSWRERYDEEFEALLQTRAGDLRTSANVIWCALCERVSPTPGLKRDEGSHSFQFQTWCARAPWVTFSLAPIIFLAVAYFVACLILWSGWRIFLPRSNTPFVPLDGYAVFYFDAGRLVYYAAPFLVGWATVVFAARKGFKAVWPTVGLILIAMMGGTAQVHADPDAVSGGMGHVSMDFALGTSVQGIPPGVFHALVIFSLTILPYLVWRLQKIRPHSD